MGSAIKSITNAVKGFTGGLLGKSGGAPTSSPTSVNISTMSGSLSDSAGETATTEEGKRNPIQKKKLGTGGTQIPLVAPRTAATTGVQI